LAALYRTPAWEIKSSAAERHQNTPIINAMTIETADKNIAVSIA
jgi:hypothetical protein